MKKSLLVLFLFCCCVSINSPVEDNIPIEPKPQIIKPDVIMGSDTTFQFMEETNILIFSNK